MRGFNVRICMHVILACTDDQVVKIIFIVNWILLLVLMNGIIANKIKIEIYSSPHPLL